MTSRTPTVTVLLDDGTGTYPTDVSSRVNLSAGVGVNGHGRTDEFSQASAATFTCTLKNDDGHLSDGTIALAPGQGIRYKQHFGSTTVNRFTGRISEAALGFTATGKASAVVLTAVDPLSSLARRPLRSMLEQEILSDSPTAYYTLGEAEGSTSAGDTSGNGNPSLTIVGTGTAPVFGNGTGPVDGLSAVTFTGGKYLESQLTSSSSYMVLMAMSRSGTPASFETLAAWGSERVQLIGSTSLTVDSAPIPGGSYSSQILTTSSITDGAIHLVGWAVDSSYPHGARLFVDDSTVDPASAAIVATYAGPLRIGGNTGDITFGGTISHAVIIEGSVLSDAAVAQIWDMISGFTETTAARFTRIAGYVGATTSTPANSGQLVGAQATSGANVLDALQTVATSEGGVMFADGSGTLVLQGRNYRAEKTTADLTLAGKDIDVGTTIPLDDQQIVNQATVTREGGATQTYPTDLVLGTTDRYPASLDLIVTSDNDALTAAQWLVNKHSTAVPRIGQATVKTLTSSQAEQIIAAEIGDRWALSGLPTQQWAGAGDLTVEGWSETLTVSSGSAEWSMTANLLPWAVFSAWVLGDTSYSVLGSTTVLAY